MKTIQFNAYGGPEVLEFREDAQPTLKPGQVLIKNKAASINAIDWKVRAGFLQKFMPVTFPATIGGDFAGVVVEVNGNDTGFKVGDEVYGQAIILNGGSGTMAEFVAANGANTAKKPKSISFNEAGALPLAGVSAIQGLEEHIKLKKGQKILIHGGAGGIGHMAIQYAKSLGAYVATTASTKDVKFVKNLGADEVIDYKTQKFELILKDYDAVFDTVGGETLDKSYDVLKKGGILVSMGQVGDETLAKEHEVSAFGQMTVTDTAHLNHLTQLVESGIIKVHVDKMFPLIKAKEAFTYQETGHPQGKVVVTI
ncbi:MAG TPA: NADP-dependent oxidoreductase [Patescibacteria group bacterium]|nr:NADP-dependent oxidoreductase [Patescibacteria group bacterium]